eukprot:scaffold4442_cov125-Amphora_coffeaeformis.AAC.9
MIAEVKTKTRCASPNEGMKMLVDCGGKREGWVLRRSIRTVCNSFFYSIIYDDTKNCHLLAAAPAPLGATFHES